MIGMIVSGHGLFAAGMAAAVRLIAAEPEAMKFIDFSEGLNTEQLYAAYEQALDELAECEAVAMLTDLTGGTPFNQAVYLAEQNKDKPIAVISGTNLAMLIDSCFKRDMDIVQFTAEMVNTGKDAVISWADVDGEPDGEDE